MKILIVFLLLFISLSSCDYSQLKKENAQLKHQVDSLSTALDKSIEVSKKYRDLAFKVQISDFLQKEYDSVRNQPVRHFDSSK